MRKSILLAAAPLAFAIALPAQAQEDWPERPITAMVGWSAGGSSDVTTRATAAGMEDPLGQRITVTNVTGALGSIGATTVAESDPNGYNWFGGAAVHGTWPVLGHADTTWSDFYSFLSVVFPTTIYVRDDAPWETIEDLVEDIENSESGEFAFGHPGAGSNGEIFANLVMTEGGVMDDVESIPYEGGREAGQFLVSGEVDFASVTMGDLTDWAEDGRIRPLANLHPEDVEFAGINFPTVTDAYPDLEPYTAINPYFGIYVNRETDDEIIVKIAEAFAEAIQTDEFHETVVEERAGVMAPALGQEADEIMSQVESARSYPLYESGVAENDPAEMNIPTITEWSWPPHDRAEEAKDWPEEVNQIYEQLLSDLES